MKEPPKKQPLSGAAAFALQQQQLQQHIQQKLQTPSQPTPVPANVAQSIARDMAQMPGKKAPLQILRVCRRVTSLSKSNFFVLMSSKKHPNILVPTSWSEIAFLLQVSYFPPLIHYIYRLTWVQKSNKLIKNTKRENLATNCILKIWPTNK